MTDIKRYDPDTNFCTDMAESPDGEYALYTEIERLQKCLEFYAEKNNYEIRVDPMTSSILFPSEGIFKDNGERARQAIKTIRSE